MKLDLDFIRNLQEKPEPLRWIRLFRVEKGSE